MYGAQDLADANIEADFGMSIFSQIKEAETAGLQFALRSSDWTFPIEL